MKHSADHTEGRPPPDLGLYLHWPFCTSKCPYCDFNSHVEARIDHDRWRRAFLAELERAAGETGHRRLHTVFFGGGTPSLMEPQTVAEILAAVQRLWSVTNDWEVTLEANPGSVEAGRFSAYRAAGVNRVSLGVQSLDDQQLARLGRRHSAAEARAALDIALRTFDRVSLDLIYARQGQSLADWQRELSEALAFGTDHLSLYQLTIEDGTPFATLFRAGKLRGLPDEDLAADLYQLTQELCGGAGLPAYEVSNHARPGAESRHNRLYWTGGDYLGIGPGAHGRLTLGGHRWATEAPRAPGEWLRQVESGRQAAARTALAPEEVASEYLMMGLRVVEGVRIADLERLSGRHLDPAPLQYLASLGKVSLDAGLVQTTAAGRLVLNAVVGTLISAWDF